MTHSGVTTLRELSPRRLRRAVASHPVDARGNVRVFERCGATSRDTAPFTDVAYAEVGKW